MEIKNLVKNITIWAKERHIDQQMPKDGISKVIEEAGEIINAIKNPNDDHLDELQDAIGDTLVTIINFSNEMHYDTTELLQDNLKPVKLDSQFNSQIDLLNFFQNAAEIISLTIRQEQLENANKIKPFLKQMILIINRIALAYQIDPIACLESAYHVIADRKGKIINNTFVKETDCQDHIDHQH